MVVSTELEAKIKLDLRGLPAPWIVLNPLGKRNENGVRTGMLGLFRRMKRAAKRHDFEFERDRSRPAELRRALDRHGVVMVRGLLDSDVAQRIGARILKNLERLE